MSISKKDVEHIAKLARLELTEPEKELFTEQLGKILTYIESLRELDVRDVPPMSHALSVENVWRPDTVTPCTVTEQILANAPERDGNYFKVPKVIE